MTQITHKYRCISFCKEYLNELGLSAYFNMPDFMHIYRKFNGAMGNAFYVGMDAADFIIQNAKPIYNDGRNED